MVHHKITATGRGRNRKLQDVDRAVGELIRQRRLAAGLSQSKLGEAAGVAFQQVQKYERGLNRVSPSRLYDLARALNCTPADLLPPFDEAPEARRLGSPLEGQRAVLQATELIAGAGQVIARALLRERPVDAGDVLVRLLTAVSIIDAIDEPDTELQAAIAAWLRRKGVSS